MGGRFVVHIGIDDRAIRVGAAAAHFRVVFEGDGEKFVLLDEILDPSEAAGWQQRSVDLAPVVGRRGTFHFESEPSPTGKGRFSAPLFAAPMVMAPAQGARRPNVILVSLDTLRGDHVGREREGRALTPNLDAFAATGANFSRAMTTYPSTTASHMSLLTGLYPARHNTVQPQLRLSREIPTAAELFGARGYATGAVTENAMLSAGAGFARGFDYYREERGVSLSIAQGQVEATLDSALAWARAHREEPFFLFVHTYQVHGPYRPPPEWDVFARDHNDGAVTGRGRPALEQQSQYAREVLYTDHEVGEFLRAMDAEGLAGDGLVVVTSDHGEEFGEHGRIGHSDLPWETVMHVPLLLRATGRVPAGTRYAGVTSLVDVLPSVMALAGLPPPITTDGELLQDLARQGGPPRRRAVYAESRGKGGGVVAARTDDHRFFARGGAVRPDSIFDLREDPGELRPLSDPHLVAEGATWIGVYRRMGEGAETAGTTRPASSALDPETAAKLRALGYAD